MTRIAAALVIVSCVWATGCASSEPPIDRASSSARDALPAGSAIESALYPPELVLDHQRAIDLDPAQVEDMRSEMQRTQSELVALEWRVRSAREALAATLGEVPVDEARALEAGRELTAVEGEIKLAHLRLLVRLGNRLTPAQRERLDALR